MFLTLIAALVGGAVTLAIGAAICCVPMGLVTAPFGGSLTALSALLLIAWSGA